MVSLKRVNGFAGRALDPMSASISLVSNHFASTLWSSILFRIDKVFKSIALEFRPNDPRLFAI